MPYGVEWYYPVRLDVVENNVPINLQSGFTATCSYCHAEFSYRYKEDDNCDAVDICCCPVCGKELGERRMGDESW